MLDFRVELEKEIQRVIDKNMKKIHETLDQYINVFRKIEKSTKKVLSDTEDVEDRVNDLEHEMEDKVEDRDFNQRIGTIEERLDGLYEYDAEEKPLKSKKSAKEILSEIMKILEKMK